MATFPGRPVLFITAWAASVLLLYGGLFGLRTLSQAELELQMHTTYIVLTPAHALGLIGLLLSPVVGAVYVLLKPRPPRAAWAVGLGALLLIYACGGAIEALAPLHPAQKIWIADSPTINQVPADSPALRLVPVLRGLQVLLALLVLLCGYALGRRNQPAKTPGSQS